MYYLSDGDQLLLGGLGLAEMARVPWGGRSPRGLTRAALGVILKPQGEKSTSEFVSCDQLEFWTTDVECPFVYKGAPLLLELGGE